MERQHAHILFPVLLAICLALAGRPAAAADSWTGSYVGASLGVATSADTDMLQSLNAGITSRRGAMVLGAEAEIARSRIVTDAGRLDRLVRIKSRVGVVNSGVQYYAVGGLAQAQGDFGGTVGYLAGVGLETHIRDNVTIGAELLHHGFRDVDGAGRDVEVNTLTGRVNYRF
ncbi:MAG: outer membrane beta-barrel protein [Rhodobacteraceae bacterium]|nr:outer membrane beta-barrel protein [Paracoccaceae bacterium]MBR9823081.1 outer membrane beta-barrel protein [Paracoccaceae bacterium]